jgi:multidrug efflux pump subunit AcrA (membrane-fusion protein)
MYPAPTGKGARPKPGALRMLRKFSWAVVTWICAASAMAHAAETDKAHHTGEPRETSEVRQIPIDDLKAVFAVVQSARTIPARARIGGTIVALSVEEGSHVAAGQQIAEVTDQKLALKIESLEAQIKAYEPSGSSGAATPPRPRWASSAPLMKWRPTS